MSDRIAAAVSVLTSAFVFVITTSLLPRQIPYYANILISFVFAIVAGSLAFLGTSLFSAFLGAFVAMALTSASNRLRPKTSIQITDVRLISAPFTEGSSSNHLRICIASKGSMAIRSINPHITSITPTLPVVKLTEVLAPVGESPMARTTEEVVSDGLDVALAWSFLPRPDAVSEIPLDNLNLVRKQNLFVFYPSTRTKSSVHSGTEAAPSTVLSLRPEPATSYHIRISLDAIDYGGNLRSLETDKRVQFTPETL